MWITASHILFYSRYIANRPREAAMMSSMPLPDFPRVMMALIGPIIGFASGLVLGLSALVAGKFVKRSQSAARPHNTNKRDRWRDRLVACRRESVALALHNITA